VTLPPVAASPWLPDGLAAVLVVIAIGWLGYVVKQWREEPERWETWLGTYFDSQSTRQGELLQQVLSGTLPDLFGLYFSLRPPSELPVDPDVLGTAAVEIRAEAYAGPQRSRDLIVRPLVNEFQVRLIDAMPELTQSLVTLPPMIEYLMTLGCYSEDLERYRQRLRLVRLAYFSSAVLLGLWLVTIVLTRAYDWTPIALLGPVVLALIPTLIAEGVRERVRGHLHIKKALGQLVNS
jgi:hypothetical protein